jgi:hypothetical protein
LIADKSLPLWIGGGPLFAGIFPVAKRSEKIDRVLGSPINAFSAKPFLLMGLSIVKGCVG